MTFNHLSKLAIEEFENCLWQLQERDDVRAASPLIEATKSNVNPRRVFRAWLRGKAYCPHVGGGLFTEKAFHINSMYEPIKCADGLFRIIVNHLCTFPIKGFEKCGRQL
jgi:hypothetical protein